MIGIPAGAANAVASPYLWFGYQTSGILADIVYLRFSIWTAAGAQVFPATGETTVDVSTTGSDRISKGRYAATFVANAAWALGGYEIRWSYQYVATDPIRVVRQPFELLDPTQYPVGVEYHTYATSTRAQALGLTGAAAVLQPLLAEASRTIERVTRRFFDPRYITDARFDTVMPRVIPTGDVVIGIDSIQIIGLLLPGTVIIMPVEMDVTVSTQFVRVYNRHLRGLYNPDDRDGPRIELVSWPWAPGLAMLAPGPMNVLAPGIYGYTDPDGTPMGRTPPAVERACVRLTQRLADDPLGLDPTVSNAARIRSFKTRDQAVSYASPADLGAPLLTGDPEVDAVLIQFLKPPQLGAVGFAPGTGFQY